MKNLSLLTMAVFLIALEILFIAVLAVSFLPSVYSANDIKDVYLRGRAFFPKEYDLIIFRTFIVSSVALSVGVWFFLRKHVNDPGLSHILVRFMWIHAGWCALVFYAFYHMIMTHAAWSPWLMGLSLGQV